MWRVGLGSLGQPWCESELRRSESVKAFIECARAQAVMSTHQVFITRSSMSAPEPLTLSAHLYSAVTLIFRIKVSSLMTKLTITALISIYYRKEVTSHQAAHVIESCLYLCPVTQSPSAKGAGSMVLLTCDCFIVSISP